MVAEVDMNIQKIEIKEKSRKLQAKWTVSLEHGQDDYDPELEKQVAKALQEEIDWEITCDLMKQCGWTVVKTSWNSKSIEEAYELREWCDKHLTGHRKGRGDTWLFEKEKDASMFIMRWA